MKKRKTNLHIMIILAFLLSILYMFFNYYTSHIKEEAIGGDMPFFPENTYILNSEYTPPKEEDEEIQEKTDDIKQEKVDNEEQDIENNNEKIKSNIKPKEKARLNKINKLSKTKVYIYEYKTIDVDKGANKDYTNYLKSILNKLEEKDKTDVILIAIRDKETIDITTNKKIYKKYNIKKLNKDKDIKTILDELYRAIKNGKDGAKVNKRTPKENTLIAFIISIIVLIIILILVSY